MSRECVSVPCAGMELGEEEKEVPALKGLEI